TAHITNLDFRLEAIIVECEIQEELKSIQITNYYFKTTAYANNLIVEFEAAVNARINFKKSVLILLTAMAKKIHLPNQSCFKVVNENSKLRILEFKVNIKEESYKQ
ncbi:5665_t:CDS:2, partial [Cetraspora pellucida]